MFEVVDRGSVTASFTPCIEDGMVWPDDPAKVCCQRLRGQGLGSTEGARP